MNDEKEPKKTIQLTFDDWKLDEDEDGNKVLACDPNSLETCESCQ